MLFPHHILMRHSRLSIIASGSYHLIWHKVICRFQLRRQTSEKTAFRARSAGLYEYTNIPFRLSNLGSNFCHIMEMCLGDQQFVKLLLYVDNIRAFAASIDEMLDHIELVFKWLEEFNLKIKPKKCHFFQCSVVFLGYVLYADGISANPKKVDKVKNWPVPTNPKELQSFLGLVSYYHQFLPKFTAIAKCLNQLVGPANH